MVEPSFVRARENVSQGLGKQLGKQLAIEAGADRQKNSRGSVVPRYSCPRCVEAVRSGGGICGMFLGLGHAHSGLSQRSKPAILFYLISGLTFSLISQKKLALGFFFPLFCVNSSSQKLSGTLPVPDRGRSCYSFPMLGS
jgi:hypothetical protein